MIFVKSCMNNWRAITFLFAVGFALIIRALYNQINDTFISNRNHKIIDLNILPIISAANRVHGFSRIQSWKFVVNRSPFAGLRQVDA